MEGKLTYIQRMIVQTRYNVTNAAAERCIIKMRKKRFGNGTGGKKNAVKSDDSGGKMSGMR